VRQYRRLIGYLRPYIWPWAILALVCMLGYSAVEGAIPFLAKYVLERALAAKEGQMLAVVVAGVALAAIVRGVLDFSSSFITAWIGQRVVTDIRNQLTSHLQTLDLTFFNRRRAGQIVSRVTADVAVMRATVTDAATSLFKDVTSLVALAAAAVWLDWVLALLALCLFPLAGLPLRYLSNQMRQISRRQQEAVGRLNAMLHENVQGNRVVKAFGREGYERERFREHDERLMRIAVRLSRLRTLPITDVLGGIALAGVIWYGGTSVIAGTREAPALIGFVVAVVFLYRPFKSLVRTNYTIQQGLAGADRVFELLDTRPQVVDRPGVRELGGVHEAIEFQHVSFAYDPGEPVLRDIDLRIPVGQVVALVGMSGGGKSTLADLIPRFYDVTAGRITIDGIDVREVTLRSLRAQIAVVTQFTFLFNDTIRNNIAYGEPNRSMDEIVAAAKAANAHDFIVEFPQGYDTSVGDLGVRLSGGQRQRLAIARALLKNAPILILDEATSALDTESEGLVQEALERLMANRTTLVVAHRLSTVRRADRIVVLVRGEIVESGTHEDLLAHGSEYRKLHELQFRDVETPEQEPAATTAVAAESEAEDSDDAEASATSMEAELDPLPEPAARKAAR
jgi:subfamily B ATP-binding cassette protein MsbA